MFLAQARGQRGASKAVPAARPTVVDVVVKGTDPGALPRATRHIDGDVRRPG
jgi:hypothetical protein